MSWFSLIDWIQQGQPICNKRHDSLLQVALFKGCFSVKTILLCESLFALLFGTLGTKLDFSN